MLVFMSDFHFMDGTAGEHYVDAGVLASTLNDIGAHAREARAEDVTLVFLGDLYDLYRSERWFDYPLEQRPWGDSPSDQALYDIFEGIVAANRETFDLLSGPLADRFGFPVEPKRLYIPGNHDRLVNEHAVLRRRVRENLGMPPGDELFPRYVLDEEHGVFARHGQEWDEFSFDGSEALASGETIEVPEEDYRRMPIGDSMVCEFAARLAPLVREHLGENHPGANLISAHMRHIVDVRPLEAAMQWASFQVEKFADFEAEAISHGIRTAATSVREVPFVQRWIEARDEFGFDRADIFQALLGVLARFEILEHQRVLSLVDKISSDKSGIDPGHAVSDFERLDRDPQIGKNIYYILYGHTHVAERHPLSIVGAPPDERYRVYLNTGTWRPVHRPLAAARGGFATWTEMTYVLVYRPGEIVSGGLAVPYPAAESWTGSVIGARARGMPLDQRALPVSAAHGNRRGVNVLKHPH